MSFKTLAKPYTITARNSRKFWSVRHLHIDGLVRKEREKKWLTENFVHNATEEIETKWEHGDELREQLKPRESF